MNMNKKRYIKPVTTTYDYRPAKILCGSGLFDEDSFFGDEFLPDEFPLPFN